MPGDQPEPESVDQELRVRREQWELQERQAQWDQPVPLDRKGRRVIQGHVVRRAQPEPTALPGPQEPPERRANRVQLARLALPDLLALLGLPVPEGRRELRGRRVRPDHLAP